jgi:alkylresorcinol/alkylpyrone synthase
VLSRELATLLPRPTTEAADTLLMRNGLDRSDIAAWLVHPGGARILAALEQALNVGREQLRWSWESMREFGNTSSAAIFDVTRRYFVERVPGDYAVAAAFGPGVSIELLLLRAS